MDAATCAKGINPDDGIEYDYSWTAFYDPSINDGVILQQRSNWEAYQENSAKFQPWGHYYLCELVHQTGSDVRIC